MARCVPLVQIGQFYTEHGRLHRVETEVAANKTMVVLRLHAVIAQLDQFRCQRVVVGRHQAAIAERPQVLRGVERKAAHQAQAPYTTSIPVRGADGLGSIFNDRDAMLVCHRQDLVHGSRLTEQMDWNDGLCSIGDRGLQQARVHVIGRIVHVHEHRRCPGTGNTTSGGKEGEGWHDHVISGSDIQGHQGHQKRIGATGYTNGVPHPQVGGQLLLQCLHLRTQDAHLRCGHSEEGFLEFGSVGLILKFEVEKRDGHRGLTVCVETRHRN